MDFAVIQTYGKQYKVAEGDVLKLPVRLDENGADSSKSGKMIFDEVLLVNKGDKATVGKPTIAKASVEAEVMQQGRDRKIIVFKYKPKKRYRVKRGHRQDYTRVKILKINT